MKRIILLISILAFSYTFVFTQSKDDLQLLKKASATYNKQNYTEAIEAYEKLRYADFEATELYYNLGNCYYRTKDYAHAMLNYERAKLLAPNDEAIAHNIKITKEHLQNKIEEKSEFFLIAWFHSIVNLFSSNQWCITSLISFALLLAGVLFFLLSQNQKIKKLVFFSTFILFFLFSFSMWFANVQNNKLQNRNTAIVTQESATVKSSPNKKGTDLFVVNSGLKIEITEKKDDWCEIKLADGKVGWLPIATIEII